jgi:hypothetical protein
MRLFSWDSSFRARCNNSALCSATNPPLNVTPPGADLPVRIGGRSHAPLPAPLNEHGSAFRADAWFAQFVRRHTQIMNKPVLPFTEIGSSFRIHKTKPTAHHAQTYLAKSNFPSFRFRACHQLAKTMHILSQARRHDSGQSLNFPAGVTRAREHTIERAQILPIRP